MQTIRIVQKSEADSSLSLHVPVDKPETEYEVVVVVQPREESRPHERSWPAGYIENTYGSIADETFVRPTQGETPDPAQFD